jgi:hypothetical protein
LASSLPSRAMDSVWWSNESRTYKSKRVQVFVGSSRWHGVVLQSGGRSWRDAFIGIQSGSAGFRPAGGARARRGGLCGLREPRGRRRECPGSRLPIDGCLGQPGCGPGVPLAAGPMRMGEFSRGSSHRGNARDSDGDERENE